MLALTVPRLAAPVLVLAAAVAYSRLYLGVHYPLDVLGGAGARGGRGFELLRQLAERRLRSRRPPQPG